MSRWWRAGRRPGPVRLASAVVAALSAIALFVVTPDAMPAAAGPDDPTDSALTLTGRTSDLGDDWSNLKVTVSQTRGLTNQAISVNWTGGPQSRFDSAGISGNYLQLMQCSGEDPAAPDFRETCVWGAGARDGNGLPRDGNRAPAAGRKPETLPADALMIPFRSQLTGVRTPDGSAARPFPMSNLPGGTGPAAPWEVLSEYFTIFTTNEIVSAAIGADGTGRATFEVRDAVRDPHLGCGKVLPAGTPRKCWLAVVPRGVRDIDGEPSANPPLRSPLATSIFPDALVFPLEFLPVGNPCREGAERRTVGTQFVARAMESWQPAMCTGTGPVFGYTYVGDSEAGQQVTAGSDGAPGLAFTADPVVPAEGQLAVVHAPVTVSAAVIAFNVDFRMENSGPVTPPADVSALRGTPVRDLKLTPRLMAKMLTQSYPRDVPNGDKAQHLVGNPRTLIKDEEFLQLNPNFRYIAPSQTPLGIMVPNGNYAYAREVWRWILADPEARAWLGGTPDEHGMKVNPYYAEFASAPAEYFPKADPTCWLKEDAGWLPWQRPTQPVCALEYSPYVPTIEDAAYRTLRADTKAQTDWAPPATEGQTGSYRPEPPQEINRRFAMSITDSASAARYSLFTAQLCRPVRAADGTLRPDDCRSPTAEAMIKAVDVMKPTGVEGVRAIDPAAVSAAPGAYPLTMVTYAAAALGPDATARAEYATLLRYAGGAGQTPGVQRGQLPPGYAPLPQALRTQAEQAATRIQNFVYVPPSTTPGPDPGGAPGPGAGGTSGGGGTSTPPTASVPAGGATPSVSAPAGSSSSAPPARAAAGPAAPGNRVGTVRLLLLILLVVGALGAVAGPTLLAIGRTQTRKPRLE